MSFGAPHAAAAKALPESAFCETNPFWYPNPNQGKHLYPPRTKPFRPPWNPGIAKLFLAAPASLRETFFMTPFEFATAGRILFGEGTLRQVPAAAACLGRCALLVTGASPDRAAPLRKALEAAHLSTILFAVPGEPTLDLIRTAPRDCDFVIAFGGGSALDAAKALAALFTNPGDPLDYLEVIGLGRPLAIPAAPCIAIPTTAGTGSEVTRNAVLSSPEH